MDLLGSDFFKRSCIELLSDDFVRMPELICLEVIFEIEAE